MSARHEPAWLSCQTHPGNGDQSRQHLPMPGDADCGTHSQMARRETQSRRRPSLSRLPHVCRRGAIRARLPLATRTSITPCSRLIRSTPCLRKEKVRRPHRTAPSEAFDVSHDEIAAAVDKSPAAVRQIAHAPAGMSMPAALTGWSLQARPGRLWSRFSAAPNQGLPGPS